MCPATSIQQAFICLQLCARHCAGKLLHQDLITLTLRHSTSFLCFLESFNTEWLTQGRRPIWETLGETGMTERPQPSWIPELTGDWMYAQQKPRMSGQAISVWPKYPSEAMPGGCLPVPTQFLRASTGLRTWAKHPWQTFGPITELWTGQNFLVISTIYDTENSVL